MIKIDKKYEPDMQVEEIKKLYITMIRKRVIVILFLLLCLLFLLLFNVSIGSSSIEIKDILRAIFLNQGKGNTVMIIRQIRLPMALMAIVVGATLGIGGCEIQTVLKNPIASPYTLGITSAASFGAAMGIVLNNNFFGVADTLVVTSNAFFFTFIVSSGIYIFSLQRRVSKTAIILFGIALNFLFSSFTMILQYIADEDKLQSLIFWTFGSLLKTTWNKFLIVFIVLILSLIFLNKNAWRLTAMTLDDVKARSIGVDIVKIRRSTIFIVSLLSAISVSFIGTIGFIGLISPHIARQIVGEDQRFFMPLSALLGSFFLSLSFLLSKMLIPGVILPIGLITSVIGIPFFISMIFKNTRRM